MPLVYVHGVATRRGGGYRESERARNALFRRLALDGIAEDSVAIHSPYWGHLGAEPAWDNKSLPEGQYESLGGEDETAAVALAETSDRQATDSKQILTTVAKESLVAAIDLLWVIAGAKADDEGVAALSDLAVRALDYAEHNQSPSWVEHAENDDQFLRDLQIHVDAWQIQGPITTDNDSQDWESLGADDWWDKIREGGSRLKSGFGRLASRGLVKLGREKLQTKVVRFLGDVFVYLSNRGDKNFPGEIPREIIAAIEAANAERTGQDPYLILVGHSMGGNILYDILTHFRTDIPVDALVTVGSQPGLFQELRLFKEEYPNIPGAGGDRVPKPPSVKHWINIFDTQDILSFVTEPIFDGCKDFYFSTGTGVHGAHSTYFQRPSFHNRLRERLAEALLA